MFSFCPALGQELHRSPRSREGEAGTGTGNNETHPLESCPLWGQLVKGLYRDQRDAAAQPQLPSSLQVKCLVVTRAAEKKRLCASSQERSQQPAARCSTCWLLLKLLPRACKKPPELLYAKLQSHQKPRPQLPRGWPSAGRQSKGRIYRAQRDGKQTKKAINGVGVPACDVRRAAEVCRTGIVALLST